ncbi:MAG: pentapeptide repeat-containing protein [Richelia sp. RM2_1_2]|nr:pentapeptide repeat-containing protein [Richelia sp. RM2_1_2]
MPPDYSGQKLRGRSFKGQNLAGADFSHADIRGTNFTGANLRGANFTGAKAGLQKRWALLLVLLSWLLSAISGFLYLFNAAIISLIYDSSQTVEYQVAGWVALVVTIIVYIIIIRQGISVSVAFAFAFAFAVTVAFAGAVAFAGTFAAAGVFTGTIAVVFAFSGAFTQALIIFFGKAFPAAFAVSGVVLSAYIAWRAMKGDEKYALVRNVAVAFAAIGGTSFRGADLTDADFTKARLKSTDFRTAKLIRTCFHKTKLIDRVRPGSSYLQHSQIRQLILTGQGQDKNFNRLDLRGINLKATLLTDASFIGTDLSEACLQDADLSRAKLVQTQLDNTDFTGATLTGAYIQDWNITHETNFRGVKCEYVYMRFPTKENPNPLRKPDNNDEVFSDGDFGDFIQPIFDTLDLYHNQGVDPRAIAISFKELAEKNPDAELEIVAMEKRGDDKFLLRAKTAPSADKSELSGQYFDTYNQIKGLPEREIQLLLAEKDNQIHRLENMVMTALERPSFYSNTQIEQVKTMTNNPNGDSQNISFGNVDGGNFQVARDNSNQQMEAKVNQGKELTQADVIQMLARIEQLVNSTPELPEADKEKSLRYLGAAKEETQASEPDKQLAAGNLKRMAQTIETASKTVESGKTLWGNIQPVLQELLPYFGVAKTFFGL